MPWFLFKPNVAKLRAAGDVRKLGKALLYERDPAVPEQAEQALIAIGGDEVVDIVRSLLASEDRRGWPAAARVLRGIGREPDEPADAIQVLIALGEFSDVAQYGGGAIPPLIVELLEGNPADEQAVCEALRALGAAAASALVDACEEAHPRTHLLIRALRDMGESALPSVIAGLGDEGNSASPRQKAMQEVLASPGVSGTRALVSALRHEDRHVAEQAGLILGWDHVMALRSMGTAAVDDLCGVIEDADVDTDVRGSAAFILGKVGDERCVDSLIRGLAGADESLGLSICMAIAVFGESAAAKLKLAEQEDPAIAEGADCGQAAMDHVRRAFKEAGF